jgi:putative oxidoreductase
MNMVQRMHQWNAAHPLPILILRVALGLILLLKGISFTSNSERLASMLEESQFAPWQVFLVSYIIFAHLFGGVFIIIGLFTRFAAALQVPILIGAVFFINMGINSFTPASELVLSIVVLLLLIYFLIEGSGELSADYYVKTKLL